MVKTCLAPLTKQNRKKISAGLIYTRTKYFNGISKFVEFIKAKKNHPMASLVKHFLALNPSIKAIKNGVTSNIIYVHHFWFILH